MISGLFEMKCSKHPAYTGQRAPMSRKQPGRACFQCAILYEVRSLITRHSKKYEIRHVELINFDGARRGE